MEIKVTVEPGDKAEIKLSKSKKDTVVINARQGLIRYHGGISFYDCEQRVVRLVGKQVYGHHGLEPLEQKYEAVNAGSGDIRVDYLNDTGPFEVYSVATSATVTITVVE